MSKPLKLAICGGEGSFAERWMQTAAEQGHLPRRVDALQSDIVAQLQGFDGFLWTPSHDSPADMLVAGHVLRAAEAMGIAVFPNHPTFWHFDDKVAQKYLLEALQAPAVPAHVFFDRASALNWLQTAAFPLVWKLRRGAGSSNVSLAKTKAQAEALVEQAFGRGFAVKASYFSDVGTKARKKRSAAEWLGVVQRLPDSIKAIYRTNQGMGRERGYAYFQDFVPGNAFDTRVTVVGHRAFSFTRNVRKNDFRASGSGSISYDRSRIDPKCLGIAFDVAEQLGSQSMAFDFVHTPSGQPLIVEMSYGYLASAVHASGGWYDRSLQWHDEPTWPQDAILHDLVARITAARAKA